MEKEMDVDGPAEPEVERVERPDGRYVIYFTWPATSDDEDAPLRGADEPADE